MESEKISKVILTINEWIEKFESNHKVSATDKETIKDFRISLQTMDKSMEELTQYHKQEQDPARKVELWTAIEDSLRVQKKVERFIDDCGIEKHEGWTTIVGDARDITFVNPPPSPLFFRGFFNNDPEATLITDDIREGNGKRHDVILKSRNA